VSGTFPAALPAALLAAVCAAAAIVEWAAHRADLAIAARTGSPAADDGTRSESLAVRPARIARALARLGRRAGLPIPTPGDLDRRLAAAGLPAAVTAADVMAVKAGAALAGALAGAGLLLPLAPGRLGLVLAAAAPAAAFLGPDWWLRRRARGRALVLAADLPDVLDLVRVAVASGLPVARALQAVGRLRGGPLAQELRVCAELVELGVPRARALDRLAARCPLPGVLALVAAVRRTDRHGTPLAPALAALAADARADRARRIQDRAARAAPKIQLVVALLLVPAAMLLMAAGLVAGMT
jgi:tight adherence protein C